MMTSLTRPYNVSAKSRALTLTDRSRDLARLPHLPEGAEVCLVNEAFDEGFMKKMSRRHFYLVGPNHNKRLLPRNLLGSYIYQKLYCIEWGYINFVRKTGSFCIAWRSAIGV